MDNRKRPVDKITRKSKKVTDVDPVPENIRQLVSLITAVIGRISKKGLDISDNKCLHMNNNERSLFDEK